jgi:hypothetical protein
VLFLVMLGAMGGDIAVCFEDGKEHTYGIVDWIPNTCRIRTTTPPKSRDLHYGLVIRNLRKRVRIQTEVTSGSVY